MLLRALSSAPKVAYVEGFFSAAEAASLVLRARQRLASRDSGSDRGVAVRGRTSRWCLLGDVGDGGGEEADVALRRAVERAAWLTGLTTAHAEPCQVVHYTPGQQYEQHVDYFSDADERVYERMGDAGNRLVSVFAYLACADAGGETIFPTAGLSVTPKVGAACVWLNIDSQGKLDRRTLHAGAPVLAGEKWGMNIWLRQRPLHPDRVTKPSWPAPPPQTFTSPLMTSVTTLKERTV